MDLAKIIVYIMMGVGGCLAAYGMIFIIFSLKAQKIDGEIIDFPYHWTTRGFIRRKRIAYQWNGRDYFYDTKMGTTERRSGPTKIRVSKNGYVYELGAYIFDFMLGLGFALVAIYLLQSLK